MSGKLQLSILLIFCSTCSQIIAETCRPSSVQNLTLNLDSTLSWTPSPDENCTLSSYLIYIHAGVSTEYVQVAEEPILDVSFLPVCETYRFTVLAVSSDDVEGPDRLLFERMPLPPDANLTVDFVKVSEIGHGHGVYLQWAMEAQWQNCADRFRVIVYDEDDDYMIDQYTNQLSLNVVRLVPCTAYTLGVVAIYNIEIEGPVTVISHETGEDVLASPKLENIKLGATTVDLTWNFQKRTENRCTAKDLHISSSVFNVTQAITENTDRLPVSVSLKNLEPNYIYVFNVTVENSAGFSEPTVMAVQTLDSS